MAWRLRFWRRVKVAPGVTVNVSKGGLSASVGPAGAKTTVGARGVRQTLGVPGTGLFMSRQAPAGRDLARHRDPGPLRLADAAHAVGEAMRSILVSGSDDPTALIVKVGHDRVINFVSARQGSSAWVAVQARSQQEGAALYALGFKVNDGAILDRQATGAGVEGLSAEVGRITLAVAQRVWHEADDATVKMRTDLVRTTWYSEF